MTNTPERDPDGQFRPEVPDVAILDAVGELEPVGTVDIGKTVDLARQNAYYRLRRLMNCGDVTRQKIGGALVWSLTGDSSTEEGGEA
jgi:hypothetical protein